MSSPVTMHKYKDIKYRLKQSKRKTLSIYIERDGTVSILAPDHLSHDEINDVVENKRYQICRQLAEWESLNESRVEREFVSGESFLYLGNLYRLEIVKNQEAPLKLYQGYFYLRESDIPRGMEVFRQFYKEKGLPKLIERVALYKKKLGVETNSVKILDLKNRWASASKNGTLNFHWKCIMAPLKVLDYIVVHELCHFIESTHNENFWNLVDKLLPDYAERKNWLREHGAGMDL